jgi:hypothetical protein
MRGGESGGQRYLEIASAWSITSGGVDCPIPRRYLADETLNRVARRLEESGID